MRFRENNSAEHHPNSMVGPHIRYRRIAENNLVPREIFPASIYHTHSLWSTEELMSGEWHTFDIEQVIDGNFLPETLSIAFRNTGGYTDTNHTPPVIEYRDIEVELIDDDDFQIESITLPNGDSINNPESLFTDILTESGEYNYEVLDGRCITTNETIEIKIDRENPTLDTYY